MAKVAILETAFKLNRELKTSAVGECAPGSSAAAVNLMGNR